MLQAVQFGLEFLRTQASFAQLRFDRTQLSALRSGAQCEPPRRNTGKESRSDTEPSSVPPRLRLTVAARSRNVRIRYGRAFCTAAFCTAGKVLEDTGRIGGFRCDGRNSEGKIWLRARS